ncbi:MAG: GNAT family N-acetyltransferase [Azospirillaceae bacterium]|nr:GNAT family N-acetyltransferase [Azospirillaceae bacterium]
MTISIRPAEIGDVDTLLSLIRDLAAFERQPEAVKATAEDLRQAGFGPAPRFEALIAELDGRPCGFALFFETYSTWTGRSGLFLEDLFVRDGARRQGIGRRLLVAVAGVAEVRGCRRLDLNVLEWNPARAFYEALGIMPLTGWAPYRVSGVALAALAHAEPPLSPRRA